MKGRSLAALLALVGCSNSSPPALSIDVRLSSISEVLVDVETFVLSVEEAPDRPPLLARRFGGSERVLRLDEVPFGQNLRFVLVGLTSTGFSAARGQSCPVDIVEGTPYPVVSLLFSRAGYFAPTADSPQRWRRRSLVFARNDGVVVVAGGVGEDGRALASVDAYNARTGTWQTQGQLGAARDRGEAAPIPGGALVVGGVDGAGEPVGILEVYRPALGFRALPGTTAPRGLGSRATSLLDGRVLITGGAPPNGPVRADSLLYQDGTIHEAPALTIPRRDHTASLFGSGDVSAVVVIGGDSGAAVLGDVEVVELQGPSPEFRGVIGHLMNARAEHTATLLPRANGDILVVGGRGDAGLVAEAETFGPLSRMVRPAGKLGQARKGHTASLLASGRVLIAGGVDADGQPLRSVEIWDPVLRDFVPARSLSVERTDHSAVELCDGTVLLVGGGAGAEIYNPAQ